MSIYLDGQPLADQSCSKMMHKSTRARVKTVHKI